MILWAMLKIVGIMLSGVLVGYLLRNRNLSFVSKGIMAAIWLLLFLLGVAVGGNEAILGSLDTIGLQELLLSVGGVGGSVVCAWVVYRFFWSGKKS